MPGKQMTIDADCAPAPSTETKRAAAGGIVERESHSTARWTAHEVREGRRDRRASICIAVNVVGGIAIGAFQKGMPLAEAGQVYSILTIGDGLVAQIPALFTSITAGFIVTRVSSEETGSNLGDEIGGEVTAQPRALMVGAVIMVIFAMIPGFPWFIFLPLAALSGFGGYMMHREATRPAASTDPYSAAGVPAVLTSGGAAPARRSASTNDADEFSLTVPLMVDVGNDIQGVIRPDVLNEELASVRRALYYDLGVPFPGISLRINEQVKGGAYSILIQEVPCGEGQLHAQYVLARETPENLDLVGIPYIKEKAFLPRIDTIWVDVAHRETMRGASIPFMEPVQILSYHIAHILRRYADEFIGIQETRFLLSRMEDRFPELVKEVQRIVPLQKTSEIFQRLVSEGVSVRNMRTILTALIDWGQKEKDTVLLTEYVRGALKRQICYRYSSGMNILPAYVLTPELEDTVRNAIRQNVGRQLPRARSARDQADRGQGAQGDGGRDPPAAQAGAADLDGHPSIHAKDYRGRVPGSAGAVLSGVDDRDCRAAAG